MACPTGCFNGGGQIKDSSIKPKELANILEAETIKQCKEYQEEIPFKKDEKYETKYKSIEKNASSVLLNW